MQPGGLEAVFLENRARIIRFLQAHGAGEAAEDLTQELWLKLSAAQTGPIAQPLSYLYRAANNLMLDRYRSTAQGGKREREWTDAIGGSVPGRSDAPSGERVLIARAELARANSVLDELGPRVAAIFRRHRVDGIGQRDIAGEMGLSLSTVEADLRKAYRAMIDLRRDLDADDPPRPAPAESVMGAKDAMRDE